MILVIFACLPRLGANTLSEGTVLIGSPDTSDDTGHRDSQVPVDDSGSLDDSDPTGPPQILAWTATVEEATDVVVRWELKGADTAELTLTHPRDGSVEAWTSPASDGGARLSLSPCLDRGGTVTVTLTAEGEGGTTGPEEAVLEVVGEVLDIEMAVSMSSPARPGPITTDYLTLCSEASDTTGQQSGWILLEPTPGAWEVTLNWASVSDYDMVLYDDMGGPLVAAVKDSDTGPETMSYTFGEEDRYLEVKHVGGEADPWWVTFVSE